VKQRDGLSRERKTLESCNFMKVRPVNRICAVSGQGNGRTSSRVAEFGHVDPDVAVMRARFLARFGKYLAPAQQTGQIAHVNSDAILHSLETPSLFLLAGRLAGGSR
jgi:hypothetical protein